MPLSRFYFRDSLDDGLCTGAVFRAVHLFMQRLSGAGGRGLAG